MYRRTVVLMAAALVCGMLQAQTPAGKAPAKTQAPADSSSPAFPVPGGMPDMNRPAPTQEENLKRAQAQADQMADLQARRIAQQLQLTPAQYAKVRTILMERQEDLRKAMSGDGKDAPKTEQERRARIHMVQEEVQRKIAAELTPEQKMHFDAMRTQARAEQARRAGMSARRPVIGSQTPGSAPATAAPDGTAPAAPPQ